MMVSKNARYLDRNMYRLLFNSKYLYADYMMSKCFHNCLDTYINNNVHFRLVKFVSDKDFPPAIMN